MAIPFNDNIPLATDEPADSQPQILLNNQNIPVWMAIDHYPFVSDDAGKHKQVTLPTLSVDPVTLAGEVAVFSKTGANSGVPELFFMRQSAATATPMTETGAGFTYLPSGLLLKWGSDSKTGYDQTVAFPIAPGVPVFTSLLFVIVTPRANTDNQLNFNRTAVLAAHVASTTEFYVNCFQLTNGAAVLSPFVWFAVGT